MHAIRGAWAGRTYALANSNDSGGKKSRVRISKEARKELVVSFIQRHQKLNNGSFPSLSLTHREVGGSFYIVREIIREVIQENRVLAPPKLLPGEKNMESFLEQYPLGSISVDPQIDVVSSNKSQYTSKKQAMDSSPIIELDQGTLDNGTTDNGSAYSVAESNESEGPIYVDPLLEQVAEAGVKELDADLVNSRPIIELDQGTLDNVTTDNGSTYAVAESNESEGPIYVDPLLEQVAEVGVKELNADLVTASNIVEDVEEKISFPEEHNAENFMEQGPIGLSSIDHQIDVESFDESETGISDHESTNEEQVLDATQVSKTDVKGTMVNVENLMEQSPTIISSIDRQIDTELVDESENGVSYHKVINEEKVIDATDILQSDQGNGTMVNGSSKAVGENEKIKELVDVKPLLERGVDGNKAEVKEVEIYQATSQTAESLVVETFPLRPVPQMDFDSDEELNISVVSVGVLKKEDTEGLQVEAVNSSVPEKTILSKESSAHDVNGSTKLEAKDTLPTGNKVKVGANGILQQATLVKAPPNKQQFNIADVGSSKTKGSNPTLDRTKLESWEATTEKSAGKEADNPLMAFIKAFVSTFVKFWN